MGIPDRLTCLLRSLYAWQEVTVRTGAACLNLGHSLFTRAQWLPTGSICCLWQLSFSLHLQVYCMMQPLLLILGRVAVTAQWQKLSSLLKTSHSPGGRGGHEFSKASPSDFLPPSIVDHCLDASLASGWISMLSKLCCVFLSARSQKWYLAFLPLFSRSDLCVDSKCHLSTRLLSSPVPSSWNSSPVNPSICINSPFSFPWPYSLVAVPLWLIPFSQPPGPSASLSSLRFWPVLLKSPQVFVQLGRDWLGAVWVKGILPKVLGAPNDSNMSERDAKIQGGLCGLSGLL